MDTTVPLEILRTSLFFAPATIKAADPLQTFFQAILQNQVSFFDQGLQVAEEALVTPVLRSFGIWKCYSIHVLDHC
jgi:hypothetical protein